MKKTRILITCPKGISPYLKEEILRLEFPVKFDSVSWVETEGFMEDTMRLNLFLRTGHRVLYHIRDFHASDPEELYAEVRKIQWEDYLHEDGYVCVTSSVKNSTINDTRYPNLKCKDAIVDRMSEKFGRRPDSGPLRDRAVIHLYWEDKDCSIYIDTSGEPLSKRRYRKIPFRAPMQETLAAAVIMATGWSGEGHFINPMCGSGTLAIEAASIALNRPPGLLRDNFGFMHIKGFNMEPWERLRENAKSSIKKRLDFRIIASDVSSKAIEAAKNNAETAGVAHLIEFHVCDFRETPVPEGGGIVMLNPEYGERMGEEKALEDTYEGIGDFFKQKCKGYTGCIFTGNLNLAKKVGLKAKRRIQFFNGSIECRLLEYELYEGSRKP
jgi:putative N6-adenine-specific DNA methylase